MKSGTASVERDAESEEEICEGAEPGSVQATIAATKAEKSVGALADAGAIGIGWALGAVGATQHDLLHEQQARFVAALLKDVWTDAIA